MAGQPKQALPLPLLPKCPQIAQDGNHHTKMTTIPTAFTKNHWHYVLRDRKANFALYSQHLKPNMPDSGNAAAYEVVVVRVRKAATVTREGKTFECQEGEFLPSNEDFGTYGWTFHTRAEADKRLRDLAANATS